VDGILPKSPKIAWTNAILAGILVLAAAGLFVQSNREAEEAVRRYGHNVDSGAISYLVSTFFLMPSALAFGLTAIAMLRGWKIRWGVQIAALAWFVLPLLWEVIEMVVHRSL
jgi:hypothetical protein